MRFKTENDLNAYLSKQFKQIRPAIASVKLAEKFHIGISDFILLQGGRGTIMETKNIRDFPKSHGKVLSHPFEPEQLSFLKRVALADVPVWGVVAVNQVETLWAFPLESIPESGNWQRQEFFSAVRELPPYGFDQIEALALDLIHNRQRLWDRDDTARLLTELDRGTHGARKSQSAG